MCGIAGKLTSGEPVDRGLLDRMCAVIRHRGPDSQGMFLDGAVGLGIQRLAIIDLQTGDQPVYNEDESVVVVLNGEIYNYRELRDELQAAGHRLSTKGDTEVIVHLYEEMGERCVERLRGMFAFALWDRRRRRLLLARDRLGKKPLFYAERGHTLWFASEAKSILQDPELPRTVDYDAIDCYLHYGYVPHPRSAFGALRKLPPAHILRWEDGRLEIERYWRLSYANDPVLPRGDELGEHIRERIMEATRLRMRSDVPLGAFLSGGVDSSAVVAAMAQQSAAPVKTFSIGFDVGSFDETRYAREVAELFSTEHEEFRVDPQAMEVLPQLVWHYGEPFADPSAIPSLYLAELTRGHVTVALNGDGGDENFAGYVRYFDNGFANRLRFTPKPTAAAAARIMDRVAGPHHRIRTLRRLRWLAHALAVDGAERYTRYMAAFAEDERDALYTADFLAELKSSPRSAPHVIGDAYRSSDAPSFLERLMDVDVQTYLADDLLVKMDIATMAHSLEVRSPLLDHEFMEMAAALPASSKLRGRTSKKVLKDALRPWIPGHILDRPKMGFSVPLRDWFRGPLRALPAEVLLDPQALQRGMFREAGVRTLIDDHVDGARDNSLKIWVLLQLELWLQSYVDREVPAPLTVGGL